MNSNVVIAAGVVLLLQFAAPALAAGQKIASRTPAQTAMNTAMMLPPTRLDSFVHEALKIGEANHIYGDEGSTDLPPYYGFNIKHRINRGIHDQTDKGLTTGHGSYLPDAWGSDEFLHAPGAQSLSGENDGNHQYNGVDGNDSSPVSEGGWADSAPSTNGGQGQSQLPPAPGPGYQPMYQHGQFVGWYSPQEVALSQTDFPAALRSILKSGRYYGGVTGAASILYEIGDISSPFDFGAAQRYMGGG